MPKTRRTEIRKIESRNARNVCFSKRRNGLFSKVENLKRLNPDINVAAIVFSPAGKPFVYGDPDSLLPRFLSHPSDPPRHRLEDLLSVDIEGLDTAELESLRSRILTSSESRVGFSGLEADFANIDNSNINSVGFSGLGADFAYIDNTNINSVGFSGYGAVNSELVGSSSGSEIVGDDNGMWSESGIVLDFNIDDFTLSDLDAQVMDSDDFLNLSELGFDSEPEKDKVVGFGDDFETNMGIEVEEDEIEAVLRDFLNEDDDNCLSSVF